jgi:fermentation-respiration switch protein FrsA (DUF1100 family)
MPRDLKLAKQLEVNGISLPALHIVGAKDEIISRERSEELHKVCRGGEKPLLEHPGAHFVPTCSGEVKQAVLAYLGSVEKDESTAPIGKLLVSAL